MLASTWVKKRAHRVAQAFGEAAVFHGDAGVAHLALDAVHAEVVEQRVGLLREHAAQRLELLQAFFKVGFFFFHFSHHVLDHFFVLAAQAGQFAQLFVDVGQACSEQALRAGHQVIDFAFGIVAHDFLFGRDQLVAQCPFQFKQAASARAVRRRR